MIHNQRDQSSYQPNAISDLVGNPGKNMTGPPRYFAIRFDENWISFLRN